MNKNLIIAGAGQYGLVAKEIAEDMGCFEKIGFVDDNAKTTPNGIDVLGSFENVEDLAREYSNIIVAIGRADIRLDLIHKKLRKQLFVI